MKRLTETIIQTLGLRNLTIRMKFLQLLCLFFFFFLKNSAFSQNSPLEFVSDYGFNSPNFGITFVLVGDLNQNSCDDLVLIPSGGRPHVFFFSPDSNRYVPAKDSVLETTAVSGYGAALLLDSDDNGIPEIHIAFNSIAAYEAFEFNPVDSTFVTKNFNNGLRVLSTSAISALGVADFDVDGRLDMLIGTNQGSRTILDFIGYNLFFKGGTSFFLDFNSEIYLQPTGTTSYSLTRGNNDNYPEAFRANAGTDKQKFFLGTENGFVDILGHELSIVSVASVGIFADLSGDGVLDFFRSNDNNARNNFLKGNGDLSYTTLSIGAPVLENRNSKGAHTADFDNDGYLDLATAESNSFVGVFQNLKTENFAKLTLDVIPVISAWNHVVLFDPDRNGQIDLLSTSLTSALSRRFYKNKGNSNNWIGFELQSSNGYFQEAIGAQLLLTATINGVSRTQIREIYPTNSFQTFHSLKQHFGLLDANSASLVIKWPSGQQQTVTVTSAMINQYNRITEPARPKLRQINSPIISSTTGNAARDTIVIRNVGFATASITSIVSDHPSIVVESFETSIASDTVGKIAIMYNPQNSDGFSLSDRALTLSSNAIETQTKIRFKTRNRGQGAPYVFVNSPNDPFFTNSDLNHNSVVGQFHTFEESPEPSVILFSEDGLVSSFLNTDSLRFIDYRPFTDTLFSRLVEDISVADFNNDGALDLFVNYQRDIDDIWLNVGDGLFQKTVLGEISNEPSASSYSLMHDFNKDGFLELLVLSRDNQLNSFYRNLEGEFIKQTASDYTFSASNGISQVVVDANFDGLDDIIVAENTVFSQTNVSVYYGGTGMQFYKTGQNPFSDVRSRLNGIYKLDFDNDTYFDLLFLPANPDSSVVMYFGSADGWSRKSTVDESLSSLSGNPSDVLSIDYNLDGWPDLFFTYSSFLRSNKLMLNVDGNLLTPIADGDLAEYSNVATKTSVIIDSNSDAIPDLLIVNEDAPNALFVNTLSAESTTQRWVAIVPKIKFPNGVSTVVPGTIVRLKHAFADSMVTQSQIFGNKSLKSSNSTALYFGAGLAETAEVTIEYSNGASITTQIDIDGTYQDITLDSGPVSIEQPDSSPLVFGLLGNFPNPFNPSTTIQYSLAEAGPVRLDIYSITGERVWTTALPAQIAGVHNLSWNAHAYSSGIYIARLQSRNNVSTLKLTLLK